MRPDAFTSTERGWVRKTTEGYRAFFPAETPRRISLSDEVVKLLDEATGAVHRLGGVGRLIPNPHLLIGPHLRLEAVLSSRIEGTKTDVGQLLLFEAGQLNARLDKRRAAIAAYGRILELDVDADLRRQASALLQELRRGLN